MPRFCQFFPCLINMLFNFYFPTILSTWKVHFFCMLFQVSIVGDFTEADIESCLLDYLGTVDASNYTTRNDLSPIKFRPFPSDLHFQQVRKQIFCHVAHSLVSHIFKILVLAFSSLRML